MRAVASGFGGAKARGPQVLSQREDGHHLLSLSDDCVRQQLGAFFGRPPDRVGLRRVYLTCPRSSTRFANHASTRECVRNPLRLAG